ncbi:DUF1013 domain-containing protein [Tepidicaulis sp.]|uniref:DUF1013 domain-containing protein n=1 Tax=Tepidicaulis sp. TaxID=1920809 RepID=UPI003B5A5F92
MSRPLMPKATAVWLVDNTALTFDQIADFCGLHALEIKGIADGDVAQGIKGLDPVAAGQLTRAEIERCQKDSDARLKLSESEHDLPEVKPRKGPRYTPVSRRQDRPDAIAWLLRHHPELTDAQVTKLVGTTKPTIQSIRDRSHWNSPNIKPVDPVTLGLCTQLELDAAVQKAARRVEREHKKAVKEGRAVETLLPAAQTTAEEPAPAADEEREKRAPSAAEAFSRLNNPVKEEEEPSYDADSVFSKLKDLKKDGEEEEDKE